MGPTRVSEHTQNTLETPPYQYLEPCMDIVSLQVPSKLTIIRILKTLKKLTSDVSFFLDDDDETSQPCHAKVPLYR